MLAALLGKIESRDSVIGIVGLGYVGLPLVLRFSEAGYRVIGFDIDDTKVDALNAGRSYIEHISADRIGHVRGAGFEATSDFSRAGKADVLILCVPTPLNKYREPDLSFVIQTTDLLVPFLREGQLLSLESTTYPGTTDEELLPRVQSRGFTVGSDFFWFIRQSARTLAMRRFQPRQFPRSAAGLPSVVLRQA